MFASLMEVFQRSRAKSACQMVLRVNLDGQQFIALVARCTVGLYALGHIFVKSYLMPYVNPNNSQLQRQMDIRLSSLNQKRYPLSHLSLALESQMNDSDGFIRVVLELWYPYMVTEMGNQEDPITFLRIQVNLLIRLILNILTELYDRKERLNPQKESMVHSRKFRLELLEMVTDSYEFQKVKRLFIRKCKQGRGVKGQFTSSQVQMTAVELNQLMKFREIPAPFHESIGLMLDFYQEYRLVRKVKLLVEAVEKAKEDIIEYRNYFGMGNTTIGSDQVMPVINFVCQRTRKNIFASIQYLHALLGGGRTAFSHQECVLNLKMLVNNADYCVELVESMSSIDCHTSKIAF